MPYKTIYRIHHRLFFVDLVAISGYAFLLMAKLQRLSALARHQLLKKPGRKECLPCGGSGLLVEANTVCPSCAGQGSVGVWGETELPPTIAPAVVIEPVIVPNVIEVDLPLTWSEGIDMVFATPVEEDVILAALNEAAAVFEVATHADPSNPSLGSYLVTDVQEASGSTDGNISIVSLPSDWVQQPGTPQQPGTSQQTSIPQHSSASAEHYTPSSYVEAARMVLVSIDLDPASCQLAQQTVKASAWYGPLSPFGEDGLVEPWLGRVFLNPPGGRVSPLGERVGPRGDRGGLPGGPVGPAEETETKSSAALWWATLSRAWAAGEVEEAIFVGFTLEILRSAQGLKAASPLEFPFCVPSSRIAFDTQDVQGERVSSRSPTHANVIIYLPPPKLQHKVEAEAGVLRFLKHFAQFGQCRRNGW